MTKNEKMRLWTVEEIETISPELTKVRSVFTGQIMIKRISDPASIDTMRSLCGIRNKNLMAIYDAEIIGGVCVSLGEYVDGKTLSELVEERGVYSEKDTIFIVASVCSGLKSLHMHDIVHRDINPNNVMIDNSGTVKIIDYDISRTVKDKQSKDTEIMGTRGFAAPEQFGFQQTSERADIYSCGVLMNYLLTGKLPNEQMYNGPLGSVIAKCIELDPKNRYTGIDYLRAVLINDRRYLKLMNKSEIESMRFRPLPGYRSKHFFPKLLTTIAIITYFIGLITWVSYILSPEHHTKQSVEHVMALIYFAVLVFGFFTLFPYLLFGDVGKYSLKMTKDPLLRKRLTKLFGWLCIILGVVLFIVMFSLSDQGILEI